MNILGKLLSRYSIYLLVFILEPLSANTGTLSLLQEGKKAFWSGEYRKAEKIFTELIGKDPKMAEAYYFSGYIKCRLNNSENLIPDYSWEIADAVSRDMEKVLELEPEYDGEIIVLSPREKIMSEWSVLALSYLNKGDVDKAKKAFKEAQKRGGMIGEIYDYMKNMLISCPNDAVLVTAGDMDTFFPLYLQVVEGLRTDVTVLNIYLCQSPWFLSLLAKSLPWQKQPLNLPFTINSKKDVGKLLESYQKPFTFSLVKPGYYDISDTITLTISPVSGGREKPEVYLRDVVFLNILKNNPKRALCIASTVKCRDFNFRVYHEGKHLDPFAYLEKRGLVDVFTLNPQSAAEQIDTFERLLLKEFSFSHFPDSKEINRYDFYINEIITTYTYAASLMDKEGQQYNARVLFKKLLDDIPGIHYLNNKSLSGYLLGLAGSLDQK